MGITRIIVHGVINLSSDSNVGQYDRIAREPIPSLYGLQCGFYSKFDT